MHMMAEFPPHFLTVKLHFPKHLWTTWLLVSLLGSTALFANTAPVIDRQPYRVLYDTNHDPIGEWPPIDIDPPRVDASSLVNIGCAIDLRIVASGPDLSYQWKKDNANIPGANGSQLYINVNSLADEAVYRCVVSNPYGTQVSMPVRMGIVDVSSSNYFVAADSRAKVSLQAVVKFPTTIGGFKYRWYKMLDANPNINTDEMLTDGGGFSGATKSKLSVNVTSTDVAGSYYCVVTAYNTYMLAGLHHLAVVPAPEPTMVQLGAPMNFSVTPIGPAHLLGGLEYQWLKDAAEIPGETNATYVVASAGTGDVGLYSVFVTHPTLDAVTTPQAAGLVIDEPVSHVLAIATGTTSLMAPAPVSTAQTFQWFRNGNPVLDGGRFSGATKAKLGIKAVEPADAGDYECRGTLYGDTVVVARPVLIVLPAPLSQVAALGGGFELEGLPEYDSSLAVEAGDFEYQWIKGSGRSAAPVDGETASAFTVATASLTDVSNYCLQLNYPGANPVKSLPAAVAVVDTMPITVNVNAGRSTSLKPVYSGRGVAFEWRRGGLPIEESPHYVGVSKNALSIVGASLEDAGDDYECIISYPGGSSVAAPFEVVVYSAPEILDFELPEMIVGGAVNYAITCSPDPLYAPQSFDAKVVLESGRLSNLPKGLVIDRLTGNITGSPTVSGSFTIRALVKNAVGTTTVDSQLVIHALPDYLLGRYTGPLPRMPAGEFCDLGGRIDLTVTSTAAVSGRLTVGTVGYSFRGVLSLDSTDPLTATGSAEIVLPRTEGNLTLNFDLGSDNYLSNGVITGAENTVAFTGWRGVYSTSNPPAEYAGRYNVAMFTSDYYGELDKPQGVSYISLNIDASPSSDFTAGNYIAAGQLADGLSRVTTASVIGPAGEFLIYQVLYSTAEKGSLTSLGMAIYEGGAVTGNMYWSCPANASTRRYPAGFDPLSLMVYGGRYVAGDRLLGVNQASLSAYDGGIEEASINPNALFDIGLGNVRPVRNGPSAAFTAISNSNLSLGTFAGSFKLADDNPATPAFNPTEYKRTVKFYGLAVPILTQAPVGYGYFVMPQIPTLDPPTTPSTSPELSGYISFDPVVPD